MPGGRVRLRGAGGPPIAGLLAWPAWLRPSKRRNDNELARAVLEGDGASTRLRFNERDLEALFGEM